MFQMSGGIYELYRHNLIAYYENLEMDSNSPLRVPIRPIKDKKGVNVVTQLRVSYRRNGKSSDTPKYTVNQAQGGILSYFHTYVGSGHFLGSKF